MGFKQRWTFVVVIIFTISIFLYVPLGNIEKCSNNCKKCPYVRNDVQVPREQYHGLNTNDTGQVKYADNHRPHFSNAHISRPQLKKNGWILDCITWENKWEVSPLDADPHEFTIEDQLKNGEDNSKREKTFQEIFVKKDWPANDASYGGLKASGPGAMLKNAQGVIASLHMVISRIKQHLRKSRIRLLDLPCGDLQWMSKFLLTRTDVDYTGADIVPEIIEHHKKTFSRIPKTKFIQWDVVKSPMNETFDLILARDLLQHLWKADAMKALQHFSESGSKFLLTTTFPDTSHNLDVEKDALGGRKYPYNLELPPFLLEPPLCSSYDWNVEHLGLWSLPIKQKYDF